MSATRNVMSSALFSMPYLNYQPVNVSNGEPALTAANLTKQTMLGAPFAWPWNRGDFSVTIATKDSSNQPMVPAQDYIISMPTYGYLEKIWLTDGKGKVSEIKVVLALAQESAVARPSSAAILHVNDDDGTVQVRLNTIADQSYTLAGIFQFAPTWMTSLASQWSPIPDHLAYIYDWGFLGFVSMLTKDYRSGAFLQRFAAHLVGAQDGLSASQRNIFLANFLELLQEPQRATMLAQQGVAGRNA